MRLTGINQTERPGRAPNRVAGPDLTLHNALLITIYWDGNDGTPPHIYFTAIDVDTGKLSLEYRILFNSIGL